MERVVVDLQKGRRI